jgi:hypothetical protein
MEKYKITELVQIEPFYFTTPDNKYGIQHYPKGHPLVESLDETFEIWEQDIEPEGSCCIDIVSTLEEALTVINTQQVV